MNATHVVVKGFDAGGKSLKSGQEVDASEWRNTDNLVKNRYLKPLPPVVVPNAPAKEAPRQQGNNQARR